MRVPFFFSLPRGSYQRTNTGVEVSAVAVLLISVFTGCLGSSALAQTTNPGVVAAGAAPAGSAEAWAGARFEVDSGQRDWNHVTGKPLVFSVRVRTDGPLPGPLAATYRLGYEKFEGASRQVTIPPQGAKIEYGTPTEPGFIRLELVAAAGGKEIKQTVTVAVSPERLRPTQVEPADFDAFWQEGKKKLAPIAPDPQLKPLPDLAGKGFEAFELTLANYDPNGEGRRVHGALRVPTGPGPFPAVLQVPGAGVRGYKGNLGLPNDQVITLEIDIHGIPIGETEAFYQDLANGKLKDYQLRDLEDRERYYYRRVILGCIRSLDFLTSHPKWDGRNLVVRGGSQGGMLALISAALEPRVSAVSAAFPAYCDVTGYLHGRAGGWPHLFGSPAPDEAKRRAQVETTGYYDVVNFARRVKVPVLFSWGYNDNVCPPTSFYAMKSVVTAPHEVRVYKESFHSLPQDGLNFVTDWTLAHLGLK